ncbi:transposase family protein [Streptomyces sp. NPDC005263]|uniref:transposase family protein n=1 Tax=Streptomyces sp. NPDC005263 TaxID=3364711 RepID=UPI003675A17E
MSKPLTLMGVLQSHCKDTDSTCPYSEPSQLTSLAEGLGRIPPPVRGRHYLLGSLLALCLVAVLGGATSLAAIARFAADTDCGLRVRLGLTSSTPNASTLGRLLARLDGNALDDAVGAWLARYTADPVDEPGDTLVGLAVDGKTVRGSRTDGEAVHLLAAALHACQTVRRLKVCTVRPGLLFPHAVQAMEIQRRRTHRKTGKGETKTVHTVTSLPPEQASAQLAELVQDHSSVDALHHMRETSPTARTPHAYSPAPHPATWPPCAISPSASCAKQAGPT